MSKRSQVTMLMVVGLVLFIVISLVLYLSKSSVKKQSQQNIKKTQESAMELQPIKDFFAKCLDKLGKDAVVLLGKQGGYIYSSQGGTLVDYQGTDEGLFFVKYNNLNVAYNILPPKFAVQPYSSEIPDYPWETFPYRTASSNAESFEGFFGISNIPPLNDSEGPNSMQSQIESFVDRNIQSCMNSGIFEEQGLSIEMQPSKTSVVIGSGSIIMTSKMPMKIANKNTNEFAEFDETSSTLSIGLKDTYYFVKDLVEKDIQNIKFDIGDQKNENEGIRIKLVKDVFSRDDLIIVTDEKSLVYGKPFEYIFARRNRAPALYYIR